MNKFTAKKIAILTLLSIILSLGIIRWHSISNVPFCHYAAGCTPAASPRGSITVTTYGYPLAYRQVEKFNPTNNNESSPDYAGYAETSVQNLSFSLASVIVNFVFWFALLDLASGFIRPRAKMKPTEPIVDSADKSAAM